MTGFFVADWQLLKIEDEINRHPGFGRDDPQYRENENTFESEFLEPTGKTTPIDVGIHHGINAGAVREAGIDAPRPLENNFENIEDFLDALMGGEQEELDPEAEALMDNEFVERLLQGPAINVEHFQHTPNQASNPDDNPWMDDLIEQKWSDDNPWMDDLIEQKPSFKDIPFNEDTGFTTGEPMDLAFRLLKDYRDTDETRHGSGAMRDVTIPRDKKKNVVKVALPFRETKLGQLPANMAISHALANMGYPILPETPHGYDAETGFSVQQPQLKIPSGFDENINAYEDKLQDEFSNAPLARLLTPSFDESDHDVLDSRRGNIGIDNKGNPILIDPRYGAEMRSPTPRMLSIAHANLLQGKNLNEALNMNEIDESVKDTGRGIKGSGGFWRTPKERLSGKLKEIGEAKEDLPEFLENYRQGDLFDPWVNAQDESPVVPGHQQQLDSALSNYRDYGDTLEYFNTLVNNPEQKRLYEFTDPQYKQNVDFLQNLS